MGEDENLEHLAEVRRHWLKVALTALEGLSPPLALAYEALEVALDELPQTPEAHVVRLRVDALMEAVCGILGDRLPATAAPPEPSEN